MYETRRILVTTRSVIGFGLVVVLAISRILHTTCPYMYVGARELKRTAHVYVPRYVGRRIGMHH